MPPLKCHYKLTLLLRDEDKISRFLMTSIAALEEAELTCAVISGMITLYCLKCRYNEFAPAFEVYHMVSSNAY
jgi:hypothetical protein